MTDHLTDVHRGLAGLGLRGRERRAGLEHRADRGVPPDPQQRVLPTADSHGPAPLSLLPGTALQCHNGRLGALPCV